MTAKTDSSKYLLETSIQIDKFKPGSKSELFVRKNQSLYSSNFVLYEFKTGFIRSLIDFYFVTKNVDVPSQAYSIWSNKFQPREKSKVLLLVSVMGQIN